MSAKHTPGPWAVSYSADGMTVDTAKPVRFNLTTAGTAVVCNVFPYHDAEHFSGEANARLIAAAPELLASLRWALGAMAARNPVWTEGENYAQARAAIAKAEGGAA